MSPLFLYAVHAGLGLVAVVLLRPAGFAGREKLRLVTVSVVGAAVATLLVVNSRGRAFRDFDKAYYPAGSSILLAPESLFACADDTLCFVNLPIVALQFTPLAALPLSAAHILFTAMGIAAIVAAYVALTHDCVAASTRVMILTLFLFNGPLWYSVRLGNVTHLILLVLIAAAACLVRGRDRTAGILLAIATLNKPLLGLLAVWLVFRGRWNAAISVMATMAVALLLSLAMFGIEPHAEWFRRFANAFGGDPMAAYNAQSVASMVARLAVAGWLYQWQPVSLPLWANVARIAVVAALTVGVIAACAAHRLPLTARETRLELALVLTLSILAAPISWTHYYAWLLMPLSFWLGGLLPRHLDGTFNALLLATVLISLPVTIWIPTRFDTLAFLMERVFLSHYVAGGIVILVALSSSVWSHARQQTVSDVQAT